MLKRKKRGLFYFRSRNGSWEIGKTRTCSQFYGPRINFRILHGKIFRDAYRTHNCMSKKVACQTVNVIPFPHFLNILIERLLLIWDNHSWVSFVLCLLFTRWTILPKVTFMTTSYESDWVCYAGCHLLRMYRFYYIITNVCNDIFNSSILIKTAQKGKQKVEYKRKAKLYSDNGRLWADKFCYSENLCKRRLVGVESPLRHVYWLIPVFPATDASAAKLWRFCSVCKLEASPTSSKFQIFTDLIKLIYVQAGALNIQMTVFLIIVYAYFLLDYATLSHFLTPKFTLGVVVSVSEGGGIWNMVYAWMLHRK